MPNHVSTICTVTGDLVELARFRETLFPTVGTNDGDQPELFDFNRIIPMPAILSEAEESSDAEHGAALILARASRKHSFFDSGTAISAAHWDRMKAETGEHHAYAVATRYLDLHPEVEEAGKKRMQAIQETGFASWYPWSIEKWGTKWGAYSVEIRDEGAPFTFKFETAWSFPEPIFAALAEQYPGLTFDCVTFDEGWNFAGCGQFGADVIEPFETCDATNELYEAVYGEPPEIEEDDE